MVRTNQSIIIQCVHKDCVQDAQFWLKILPKKLKKVEKMKKNKKIEKNYKFEQECNSFLMIFKDNNFSTTAHSLYGCVKEETTNFLSVRLSVSVVEASLLS